MEKRVLCICSFVGLASCSSTPNAAGSGSPCGSALDGGTMTWLINGTSACSVETTSRLKSDSIENSLLVSGQDPSSNTISLSVNNVAINTPSPAPLPGTYTCSAMAGVNGGPMVEFSYDAVTIQRCTITITQGGSAIVNAQGTFSASGTGLDGGVISITNGSYNLPITDCTEDELPCNPDGGPGL